MGAVPTKESKHYPAFEASLPSLRGKIVAITGCTTGFGLVTAICAARKGADHILMLNRSSERATKALETVQAEATAAGHSKTVVETIPCDLQDLDSVRAAAASIHKKCTKLDVLCNNAGIMAFEDFATKDGFDVQMQTNHLSHFLLTKELFPLLQKSADARIVNHSSGARSGKVLQSKYFEKNGGNLGGNSNSMIFGGGKWERYHQTKLANSCFTAVLASKLETANMTASVKAVCAAPGLAQTNLQTTAREQSAFVGIPWAMHLSQSAEDGSMPLITACFGPDVQNGEFYEPKNSLYGLAAKVTFDKNSLDVAQQQILWEASEAACGSFTF